MDHCALQRPRRTGGNVSSNKPAASVPVRLAGLLSAGLVLALAALALPMSGGAASAQTITTLVSNAAEGTGSVSLALNPAGERHVRGAP